MFGEFCWFTVAGGGVWGVSAAAVMLDLRLRGRQIIGK